MPQPDDFLQHAYQDHTKQAEEQLKDSFKQLNFVNLPSEFGLSQFFQDNVVNTNSPSVLCEQAMERLETIYVECLTNLEDTSNPLEKLTFLDQAESVWQESYNTISEHDQTGKEKSFLLQMRQNTLIFLERQLIKACKECQKDAKREQVSLCIALIAVLDRILKEHNEPVDSAHRQRYRKMIQNFK